MRSFEVGLALPLIRMGADPETARWSTIRDIALRAEAIGFDTLWVPDELLWRTPDVPARGAWDAISMGGAVAVVTSHVQIGTWVLSALHRNPAIIAKTVETLDELSGGRFVFGLGAGHAWPGQANAFGLPEDHIFDRFEEALRVIIPLLREGRADFEGEWHAARQLEQLPLGPRPGRIPIMIGGNGPRGQRQAVRHADTWSCYIEQQAHVDEVRPRIESLERICEEEGRDPASIGRSVGVVVDPREPAGAARGFISGNTEQMADALRSFQRAGFTRAEVMIRTATVEAVEALGPVLALLEDG